MKQCETCIFRDHKKDLICCNVAELGNAIREIWKGTAIFSKGIPDYECQHYLHNEVD